MSSSSADVWRSGDAYEPYIGRWSRLVARKLIKWLAMPPGARWLDVGCGTGALTQEILRAAAPACVEGVDPSSAYVAFARHKTQDTRATFVVADAQSLPQHDETMDAVASGLALNFIPRPDTVVAEMARVTRVGGIVAVYIWDYAGEMQLIRRFWDAAVALDPSAAELDEARRFPICHAPTLEELFRSAGLKEVESRAIDVPTRFRDFDDYWNPFLGGQGPAPTYVTSLDDERRAALRERIRASLPVTSDGSIDLMARAWAVKGTRR